LPDPRSSTDEARQLLRSRIREQRADLTAKQRRAAELRALAHLRQLGAYRRARRVGAYFCVDGELSVGALMEDARRRHKRLYVPVLTKETLRFAAIDASSEFSLNRFGIPEPRARECLDPRSLDVVITPLVAFDDRGARLGMGGGYYDRCFRFLSHRSRWSRPKLVGVGYELQRVQRIDARSWDVGLWCAVTELGTYFFGGRDIDS